MTSTASDLVLKGDTRIGEFRLEIDVTIPLGGTTALVGPNGAGKTTLLRVIAGLTPLERGTVRAGPQIWDDVDDIRRHWVTPQERDVAMVFADQRLFDHLSVHDNVAFGPRARGLSQHDARARSMQWIQHFNLSDLTHRRPAQLSHGQRQRVALARALASESEILLLDEPVTGLDTSTRAELFAQWKTFLARREEHLFSYDSPRTVLVVSHETSSIQQDSDAVIAVKDGVARNIDKGH